MDESLTFAAAARGHGLSVHTRWTPGGHTWDVWDEAVHEFLKFCLRET